MWWRYRDGFLPGVSWRKAPGAAGMTEALRSRGEIKPRWGSVVVKIGYTTKEGSSVFPRDVHDGLV